MTRGMKGEKNPTSGSKEQKGKGVREYAILLCPCFSSAFRFLLYTFFFFKVILLWDLLHFCS